MLLSYYFFTIMKSATGSKSLFTLPFLLMLIVACSSCSSSTSTPPGNNNTGATRPKVGSTFTDSSYTKDNSLSNVAASGTTVTYTLVDTNATKSTMMGGVYEFTSPMDTIWQHYETNGDLSVYAPFAAGGYYVGSEWITFPVSSQSSSNIPTLKGYVLDSVTVNGTMAGEGSGTQQIGMQSSLSVQKAQMNISAVSALAGTVPGTVSVSYAPSIGFVTHETITTTGMVLGTNISGGSDKFLISYNLK